MMKANPTPKRLAYFLIDQWFNGGHSPWFLTISEIEGVLDEFGYKVTEKRRSEILFQVGSILKNISNRAYQESKKLRGEE